MTPLINKLNGVSCDVSYHVMYDVFEIRGWNWYETDDVILWNELFGCGIITNWHFEWTPDDCCFQWYASGRLPNGVKGCVDRAVRSAGGSSKSRCN